MAPKEELALGTLRFLLLEAPVEPSAVWAFPGAQVTFLQDSLCFGTGVGPGSMASLLSPHRGGARSPWGCPAEPVLPQSRGLPGRCSNVSFVSEPDRINFVLWWWSPPRCRWKVPETRTW